MARKDILGRSGEQLAADFLEKHGYRIVERNWRGIRGELDIIAEQDDTTVFVEVKTRSGSQFGHPFHALTPKKIAALRRLAGEWCHSHDDVRARIRLDAIAVLGGFDAPAHIEHLRGIS